MKRQVFLLALGVVFAPRATTAQGLSIEDATARLFTAPELQADWFTTAYLKKTPLTESRAFIKDVVSSLGRYDSISEEYRHMTLAFLRGTIRADGKLTGAGQFSALSFSRMQSQAVHDRLDRLCRAKSILSEWFDETMMKPPEIARIRKEVAEANAQYGPFINADSASDGTYNLEFAQKTLSASAFLGPTGKFKALSVTLY